MVGLRSYYVSFLVAIQNSEVIEQDQKSHRYKIATKNLFFFWKAESCLTKLWLVQTLMVMDGTMSYLSILIYSHSPIQEKLSWMESLKSYIAIIILE